MAVDSTHPEYDANVLAWWRARDVYAGEDAIKAAGARYLPRLDSQTDDEYRDYKARASFFNATARTAEGLVGLMLHREPTIRLPAHGTGGPGQHTTPLGRALKQFVNDADMLGTKLTAYTKTLAEEIILVGRAGTLVDWQGGVSHTGTEGEQRAYAARYRAEDILNWRTERVDTQVADAPHLFESNAGGGAAGNGAGGAAGSQRSVRNPFRKESWNLTEQMKLQKTYPQLAARLKAAA